MDLQIFGWAILLCWASSIPAQGVTDEVVQPAVKPTEQPNVHDSHQSWQLYRQLPSLKMEYRDTVLSDKIVLGIKVQLIYQGRLAAFLRVLRDTARATTWLDSATSVVVIAQPSAQEDWVLTTFDTPWPLQPRDMVTCSTWQQTPDYVIKMNVTACPDVSPPVAKTVRINHVSATWQLTPLPNQQVQLTYIGTADAGGGLPRWLSDKVALSSSWQSFKALQLRLALAEYQQQLPEICEVELSTSSRLVIAMTGSECLAKREAAVQRLK